MAKIRTLVADDNAVFRRQVCDLLSLYDDMEVVGEAADGKEAIEKARELAPDVVLMDIAMPFMDGLDACRHIHKKSPKTRVLILSRDDSSGYVSASIEAGALAALPREQWIQNWFQQYALCNKETVSHIAHS